MWVLKSVMMTSVITFKPRSGLCSGTLVVNFLNIVAYLLVVPIAKANEDVMVGGVISSE